MIYKKSTDTIKFVDLQDSTRWTISFVDITRAPYNFFLSPNTDTYAFSDDIYFRYKKTIQDTFEQPEYIFTIFDAIRSYEDTVEQNDYLELNSNVVYSDSFEPSDYVSTAFNAYRIFQEDVNSTDYTSLNAKSVQSDSFGFSDYILYRAYKVFTDTFSQSEQDRKSVRLTVPTFDSDYVDETYFDWYASQIPGYSIDSVYSYGQFSNIYSPQDNILLRPNKNVTDVNQMTDISSVLFDANRIYLDILEQSESQTITFNAIRSYTDSVTQTESDRKNYRLNIFNPTIQDYTEDGYFAWKANNEQNYQLIYNNTPGTPYSYSMQENVIIYLNGVLVQ